MNLFSYLLTFTEGILAFISPCILPMLPIYFIYLAGISVEDSSEKSIAKRRLLLNSIGFVIGFTVVFAILGATATSLGHFLTNHKDLLQKLSGIIMIFFGLSFLGIFKLDFLGRELRINYKFNRLNFFSSILFGIIFGFGWTPCLGPFLGSALALAGNSKTLGEGMSLLILFSIGLGIPFIITAILFEQLKNILKQIQNYNNVIKIISGILLIVAGILIFTDSIKYLSF